MPDISSTTPGFTKEYQRALNFLNRFSDEHGGNLATSEGMAAAHRVADHFNVHYSQVIEDTWEYGAEALTVEVDPILAERAIRSFVIFDNQSETSVGWRGWKFQQLKDATDLAKLACPGAFEAFSDGRGVVPQISEADEVTLTDDREYLGKAILRLVRARAAFLRDWTSDEDPDCDDLVSACDFARGYLVYRGVDVDALGIEDEPSSPAP